MARHTTVAKYPTLSPPTPPNGGRVVVMRRVCVRCATTAPEKARFTEWEVHRTTAHARDRAILIVPLGRGGTIRIHPGAMSMEMREAIENELCARNLHPWPTRTHHDPDLVVDRPVVDVAHPPAHAPTTWFRQYEIRNVPESRLQLLMHAKATGIPKTRDTLSSSDSADDHQLVGPRTRAQRKGLGSRGTLLKMEATFESTLQPCYYYNNKRVCLKARPMGAFPCVEQFAQSISPLDAHGNPEPHYWTFGAHAVLYRCGKDIMGWHADDDNDEERIYTVIAKQHGLGRIIAIRAMENKRTQSRSDAVIQKIYLPQVGDEEFHLLLKEGDAYEMDGVMQEFYQHCVCAAPKQVHKVEDLDASETNSELWKTFRRLVLVFRHGKGPEITMSSKDSGEAMTTLRPRSPICYQYGLVKGLVLGRLYTRKELMILRAHQAWERGVSGNIAFGCDAIVISQVKATMMGSCDTFTTLGYDATRQVGAGALFQTFQNQQPVRVFRSSKMVTSFRAVAATDGYYRYDGLYHIRGVQVVVDTNNPHHGAAPTTMETVRHISPAVLYRFSLERDGSPQENQHHIRRCVLTLHTMSDEALCGIRNTRVHVPEMKTARSTTLASKKRRAPSTKWWKSKRLTQNTQAVATNY